MKNILNFLRKNDIGKPPWEYDFLYNLPESEYPKYLAKFFNYRTGEKLPLTWDFKNRAWIIDKKRCKTFNQKIQWIKLYGVTDLMRDCTDKVKVRDYVKEKIGEEYLKPALQIIGNCSPSTSGRGRGEGITLAEIDVSTYFDQINWDKLPKAFVIKTNHASKWQYIIKDKEDVLNTKPVVDLIRRNMTGWLEQEFWCWEGFEMQYKSIEPKIMIEPLMRDNINKNSEEIHVFCFSNEPKFLIRWQDNDLTLYDEKLNIIDDVLSLGDIQINKSVDDLLMNAMNLSKKLSVYFKFVRIDWMIYNNNLYFSELTFTPHSGFNIFKNKKIYKKFSNYLRIGENYEF